MPSSTRSKARPGTLAVLDTLYRGFWRIQLGGARRVLLPFQLFVAALMLAVALSAGALEIGPMALAMMVVSAALFVAATVLLRRLNARSTRARDVRVGTAVGFALGRWCRRLRSRV